MTFEISRKYEFSSAHRIEGHPKCGHLHGHNYTVEVVLSGEIKGDGMLMDYGELDKIVKPFIDAMDHHYLETESEWGKGVEAYDDVFLLHTDHSTAEEIARMLWDAIRKRTNLIKEVSVWETPKSKATYRP